MYVFTFNDSIILLHCTNTVTAATEISLVKNLNLRVYVMGISMSNANKIRIQKSPKSKRKKWSKPLKGEQSNIKGLQKKYKVMVEK